MTSAALKQAVTGQAPAQAEARNDYERLKRQLESSKHEFKPLLGGSDKNVDAFIRVVLNAVMANPDLIDADRRSLIIGCMKAAQDGLMPDGREAVLNIYSTNVARRNEPEKWVQMVQYLPMVGGLIKKLYLSGDILSIDAAVAFEHDHFKFIRGDEPCIEHEPTAADDPGGIIAAYCVVKLKSGEKKREVMYWRDIAKVRAASSNPEGAKSPWVKWLDQMCIKSVIHRIYKQLPKSEAFEQVQGSDNEAMGFRATPESIADITARHAPNQSAAPAQHAGPALDYTPATGGFGFEIPAGRGEDREPLNVGGEIEQVGQARNGASNDDQRQAVTFNEAAFLIRVDACTTPDGLDLLQDEARSISDRVIRARVDARCEDRRRELQTGQSPERAAPAAGQRGPRRASGPIPEVK